METAFQKWDKTQILSKADNLKHMIYKHIKKHFWLVDWNNYFQGAGRLFAEVEMQSY